mgnify:CR=1 FL=1
MPLDWFPKSAMWNNKGGEYMKRKLGYDPVNRTILRARMGCQPSIDVWVCSPSQPTTTKESCG